MKKTKIRSKLVIIKSSQRAGKVITAKSRNQFKQSNKKTTKKLQDIYLPEAGNQKKQTNKNIQRVGRSITENRQNSEKRFILLKHEIKHIEITMSKSNYH